MAAGAITMRRLMSSTSSLDGGLATRNAVVKAVSQVEQAASLRIRAIPRFINIGGQSTAKTSVVSALFRTELGFTDDAMATRRPCEIQSVRTAPGTRWHAVLNGHEHITSRRRLQERLTELNTVDGMTDRPIRLTIYDPDVLPLRWTDLPGLILTAERTEDRELPAFVQKLVFSMAKDPSTVLIVFQSAGTDALTSLGLQAARSIDPSGSRSLGVVTKLDLASGRHRGPVVKLLKNEAHPMKLGRVGVRCRTKDQVEAGLTLEQADEMEAAFLGQEGWHTLADKHNGLQLGMPALREMLSAQYVDMVLDAYPAIAGSVDDAIEDLEDTSSLLERVAGVSDVASDDPATKEAAGRDLQLLSAQLSKLVHMLHPQSDERLRFSRRLRKRLKTVVRDHLRATADQHFHQLWESLENGFGRRVGHVDASDFVQGNAATPLETAGDVRDDLEAHGLPTEAPPNDDLHFGARKPWAPAAANQRTTATLADGCRAIQSMSQRDTWRTPGAAASVAGRFSVPAEGWDGFNGEAVVHGSGAVAERDLEALLADDAQALALTGLGAMLTPLVMPSRQQRRARAVWEAALQRTVQDAIRGGRAVGEGGQARNGLVAAAFDTFLDTMDDYAAEATANHLGGAGEPEDGATGHLAQRFFQYLTREIATRKYTGEVDSAAAAAASAWSDASDDEHRVGAADEVHEGSIQSRRACSVGAAESPHSQRSLQAELSGVVATEAVPSLDVPALHLALARQQPPPPQWPSWSVAQLFFNMPPEGAEPKPVVVFSERYTRAYLDTVADRVSDQLFRLLSTRLTTPMVQDALDFSFNMLKPSGALRRETESRRAAAKQLREAKEVLRAAWEARGGDERPLRPTDA